MIFILFNQICVIKGYTYTGTIHENGDEYWDGDEYTFIRFDIFRSEHISLRLSSSSGDLELLLCYCSSFEDVNNILISVRDYGYSSRLYLWIDSYSVTSGTFNATTDMTTHAVILSSTIYNPYSISFTIVSNIAAGNRLYTQNDDSQPQGNSNDGIDWFSLIIVLGIVGWLIYRNNKKNQQKHSVYGYNNWNNSNQTNSYKPYYGHQGREYQSRVTTDPSHYKYCSYCGKQSQGIFCNGCGTRL